MPGNYYVYIAASLSRTLYVGVTSDLLRRVYEHRHMVHDGFTARYNITRLVYLEHVTDVTAAIAREKQIKAWSRKKKAVLIEEEDPAWIDLADALFPGLSDAPPPAYPAKPATSTSE